jgi:uncharacterized protein (DUF58 family)
MPSLGQPRLHAGPGLEEISVGPLERLSDRRHEARFRVRGRRVGDWRVLGLRLSGTFAGGLFDVSVDLPAFAAVRVLPGSFATSSHTLFDATRAASDSSRDAVVRRQRGSGLEIRELREFAAGDPFKHIAWHATARRGRIMVREFETDARLSAWLVLDISPSLFWGETGRAPIDRAIELVALVADTLLAGRDRVGLVIHDHRVRLVIEPGQGHACLQRIIAALLEVPHFIHEDRTELTHDELLATVDDWFQFQRGVAHRLPPGVFRGRAPGISDVDESHLLASIDAFLQDMRAAGLRQPLTPSEPFSVQHDRVRLRQFCRVAGIQLPPEQEGRPGGQAHGLLDAVEAIMAHPTRGHGRAQTLIVVSDLLTSNDAAAMKRIAVASRRNHHQLVFVSPVQPREAAMAQVATPPRREHHLVEHILRAQTLIEEQRRREIETWLRPCGAVFVPFGEADSLVRTLLRVRNAS